MRMIDRTLRSWQVWLLNLAALGWFSALFMSGARALPGISTSRCPVGMCLTGYEPGQARAFFASLGPEGRRKLASLISTSDQLLTALAVVALAATLLFYTRGAEFGGRMPLSNAWRLVLLALPILFGLADYGENAVILRMLARSEAISDQLAHAGSLLSAAKSQLLVASVAFAGAFVVVDWVERRWMG